MSNTSRKPYGHIAALAAAVVSIAIALFLLLNRQAIVDHMTVWQYQPSAEIAELADRSTMSDKGKFYFYASQPSLNQAESFNVVCDRAEENTAILGCYSAQRIYIYDIEDKRLDGIREVTAAHEMLHAVYERMGENERAEVDKLLEAEYDKLKDDKSLAERMSFYARTEPGQRTNELHSMIGAEITDIDPALEEYYKQYFTDRSKLTDLYTAYVSVFESLQNRAETLSKELTGLGARIESDSANYNVAVEQLNQDIAEFNSRANAGSFVSQAQFNNERAVLVSRANQLDVQRSDINSMIERYEVLRKELETVASQSEALNKSIDSSLSPAPSI